MKELKWATLKAWLETYGSASRENDPQASADLFSLEAQYYETPFDESMIRRETIYQYWSKGAQTLKDKESAYEILSVKGNLGIARWQSKFTVIKTGKAWHWTVSFSWNSTMTTNAACFVNGGILNPGCRVRIMNISILSDIDGGSHVEQCTPTY